MKKPKPTVTDEIQAAIAKASAESNKVDITLVLTKVELSDLFDMLFSLQQTDKGLVPIPRVFRFDGQANQVAASAAARTSLQGKVFELLRKSQGGS